MRYLAIYIILMIFAVSCMSDSLFSDQARQDYRLIIEGAEIPIVIEGNTNSKIFFILLHGGPGGTAQEFNAGSKPFTDVLESQIAMVYYDQRNAGMARGEWNEENLTIERHIQDLDIIIDFITTTYGEDIAVFLGGHSWGGYLGTSYILNKNRQSKIKSWININGNTNRNLRNFHNMEQMQLVAEEQINENINITRWQDLLNLIDNELDKNISTYDAETEKAVNSIIANANNLIDQDGLTTFNTSSSTYSIYTDIYDPFLILVNDRKGSLIEQMYAYDTIIDDSLSNVNLPVLSIYGKYDFITAAPQGTYLIDNIATPENDKKQLILQTSGHSSMLNQPKILADELLEWISFYK